MKKFYLRELCKNDHVAINKWRNDREVVDFLNSPFRFVAQEVEGAWLESYLSNRANNVRLAICHEDGALIGAVYLLAIDWVTRACELAVWIGEKKFQGQGVGYFATQAILSHAFLDLNLNRVYLTVLKSNERAINLYKKCGFSIEGMARQAVYKNGAYVDVIHMSILSDEFSGKIS